MIVYIAGPMSIGPWEHNMRQAIDAAADVLDRGHTPIVPHLWYIMALVHPDSLTHERCIQADLELVRASQALIRLPGTSVGADYEVEVAMNAGIPVYHSTIEWSVALREAEYGKV
jgi:hypothetical protein